jgi:RND family efflux transporter MFP subunit
LFSVLLLALASVAASCQADPPSQKAGAAERPPAPVTTTKVTETVLRVERSYLGEVWAAADASLSVAEAGRVRKVHVSDGDRVKRGQLLLELDDRLARAELGQALAEREQVGVQRQQAVREAVRFRQLQAEQVSSELESERQDSQAEVLKARSVGVAATVQAQSERVQRHRILAPFAGVVARRHVDAGDWLTPGQAALELVTDERVEVLVRVPHELLNRLSTVKSVTLASGDKQVSAKLSGSVNALERSTRTALIRLDPNEPREWLRAGSTVSVRFRLLRQGGLVVPRDALVQGVASMRVIRVVGGKAVPANVDVIATHQELAMVQSEDLKLGDAVVVRGNERLRPNQSVQAVAQPATKSSSGTENGSKPVLAAPSASSPQTRPSAAP